ncbi:MAG: indolepyruvate ferredoxin oxidoreductase subunit alpha [Desulfovibrionaceae bacterium]
MAHPLLANTPGAKHLLLGNEAIVRGALEAGIQVVTCYPGTPSSEVPDTFHRLSKEGDFYFEYSINEKVAMEVAGGAAIGGALTLVTMKHVGVNVAADPLLTLTYVGAPGGLVLLSADDPGCHSSQNEQDNRYYARMAGMPCFEPATAQEAKDMARDALAKAREWEQPVMLRTTTRVNHLRGPVEYGPLPGAAQTKPLTKNPQRFVPVPAIARVRHGEMIKNLETARAYAESCPWNTVTGSGGLGILCSGISRAYVADALAEHGWTGRVRVFELGMSHPLPEKMLEDFIRGVDTVLVVEEGEPLVENDLRALAHRLNIDVTVLGKGEALTRFGEYATTSVADALSRALDGKPLAPVLQCAPATDLPVRPPNLCAGCSHRAVYYAVRKIYGDNAVYSSDIGCYTLGILPPLKAADFLLCMGSSISAGSGMAKVDSRPVVAFIGDSTFFHSGITGLINAVHNRHDILLVILDNRTTAMTGHQLNPGVDQAIIGDTRSQVDIEAIVRGCGVQNVLTVGPFNVKKTRAAIEELKEQSGVRVLIAREPCVLFARRTLKKASPQIAEVAVQSAEVQACLDELGCPAFYRRNGQIAVDAELCAGCMVCLQTTKDIKARKRSAS